MRRCKRHKKIPHEDSYLRIFSRHSVRRSSRKHSWPDCFSLAEKKLMLACSIKNIKRDESELRGAAREVADTESTKAGVSLLLDGSRGLRPSHEDGVDQLSQPQSHRRIGSTEAQAPSLDVAQDTLTLENCWPTSELTLEWLRLGRAKMEAFQEVLRQGRRLSSPIEACHWPLPACARPAHRCVALNLKLASALPTASGECSKQAFYDSGDAANSRGGFSPLSSQSTTQGPLNRERGGCKGGNGPESACTCTFVRDCALIISEDPLLRPSLLAMSLGISEVHTVVVSAVLAAAPSGQLISCKYPPCEMREANWERALTVANCLGRPDSLKVFRSLEALEQDIFGASIAKILTGELVPPHTCKVDTSPSCQQQGDARRYLAQMCNKRQHCRNKTVGNSGQEVTLKELQDHLHRYRIVLIDDHYCGPIVSAFGLPLLLEFVRTHTCPACCLVLPRRWQTLVTPVSCPPLVPSGQYAKVVEGERPNELLIRRFAQSGRAMSGESVRLEDVALSDRFCVFESFELASLTRCSYKDPAMAHNVSCKYATTESATLLEGNRTESKDAGRCTFHDEAWRRNCLPCARDRQLSWSKERQTVVNGSAVCGIEVAGPCAGLIIRSYILVDEGISLAPSAPLMVFLPEEVYLSTHHVVMLGPAAVSYSRRAGVGLTESASIVKEGRATPLPSLDSREASKEDSSEDPRTADLQSAQDVNHRYAITTSRALAPSAAPWRNLKFQQPNYSWKWTALCDGTRIVDLGMEKSSRVIKEGSPPGYLQVTCGQDDKRWKIIDATEHRGADCEEESLESGCSDDLLGTIREPVNVI